VSPSQGDEVSGAFDDILDALLRGVALDVRAFLAAHPDLAAWERDQILHLSGLSRDLDDTAAPGGSEAPPATRFGPYRLGRRIGAGGMGAVFIAEDESLRRTVAVKLMGPDLAGDGERAERFLREMRAVARLNHPHIVTVYATGEQDGVRYMAMEHLSGSSLGELLARAAAEGTRPQATDVLRWGIEIAGALQAAHEAGLVHRDVKPSNIRITEDGRAVLLDFGLARDASEVTLTESGAFHGSPQYAAPEQVGSGRGEISARTDVYSLGATLYEALSGSAPLRGETREQLFHAILSQDPIPLGRLAPGVPRDLETVVMAALAKEPARRHPTAGALAADLAAVRDGRPVSVRPLSPIARAARWARRAPAKAALVAALAAGIPTVAALGGFIFANLPKIEESRSREREIALDRELQNAFLELGEGDPVVAEALFSRALASNPDSAEAMLGRAFSMIAAHESDRAIAHLDSLDPEVRTAGWAARARIAALERLRRTEPNDPTSVLGPPSQPIEHLAEGLHALDRHHRGEPGAAAEAFDALQRAVLASPSPKALYHYEFGHAAWHAGRDKEARAVAAAIEILFPESPERRLAVARTLLRADRKAAAAALSDLARDPPRSVEQRSFVAYHLAQLGQTPETRALALELARARVLAQPQSAPARRALGCVLIELDRFEEAADELREAVRLGPALAESHRTLARALVKLRQYEEAVEPARRAVELEPGVESGWNVFGIALAGTGNLDGAVASYEKGLAIDPEDAQIWYNLGCTLRARGDHARALEAARKAHDLGSRQPKWRQPSAALVAACERALAGPESRRLLDLMGDGPASRPVSR
jgi:serine/threonine protein kinase/Flp pilus assembly protein TadD